MASWDDDSPRLEANLEAAFERLREQAEARERPTDAMVKEWHRIMMSGLDVPEPAFVGRFRGEEGVEWIDVRVAECLGTPWAEVATELDAFVTGLGRALAVLDEIIPAGAGPADRDQLSAVLTLTALTHARWVAIHPFVNGNGRTARMWADWIALRYGLPAFVRLRPRPDMPGYAAAARAALCRGEFEESVEVFGRMYDRYMDDQGVPPPGGTS